MEINVERVEEELRKAKSIITLVQSDITNVDGESVGDILFGALESVIDSLNVVEQQIFH